MVIEIIIFVFNDISFLIDMFVNTKMDCGACTKIHSEALKSEFEREEVGDRLFSYDYMLDREFTSRVNEIDRIIEVSLVNKSILN